MKDEKFLSHQEAINIAVELENEIIRSQKPSTKAVLENKQTATWKTALKRYFKNKPKKPEVSIVIPVFNKIELTLACLESISKQNSRYELEVIVIDNFSSDSTFETLRLIKGINYVRNNTNEGFVGACNQGAELATGKTLVFLNNDTEVQGEWLNNLVDGLSDGTIGMTGSKLIYPDGRLQEAGGIIFSDGSGHNYGKNGDANDYHFNYLRDVDYCSGASIAIDKEYFKKLGGFDNRYAPAYYEDVDLAMKVRKSGKRVVYVPRSVVVHIEGATSGTDTSSGFKKYQTINHTKFVNKWKKELIKHHHASDTPVSLASRYGKKKQVLIIDSIVPEFDRDAGSLRMWNMINIFQKLGYNVSLFPDNRVATIPYTSELQAKGVEVIYGTLALKSFYQERQASFDVVVLSRPLNSIFHIDLCKAYFGNAKIIYDTVDLHFLRVARQAEVEKNQSLDVLSDKWQKIEYYLMDNTDTTLVVSYDEQKLLNKTKPEVDVQIVSTINQSLHAENSLVFEQRQGMLFVGSSHPPNEDAVKWFIGTIMPIIKKNIPDIAINLLGSNPSKAIQDLASENIIIPGFIENINPYFQSARIFVCPMRYGAGVKGKLSQALANGLPIISTTIGAEGMHLEDEFNCLIADTPAKFAQQVLRLYSDPVLWSKIQKNAIETFEKYFSENAGLNAIKNVVKI